MENDNVKFSALAGFQDKQKEASDAVKLFKYILYGGKKK